MTGEDEARRDPRRRINRVTLAGVLVGVLVMAGFGIAGFLGAGRGPGLPDAGAVLVSGSGDRYAVVDGRLHPALNLASALLVGGDNTTQVRPAALDAVPRGLPVGIPDAPDALPLRDRLTDAAWTVCAVQSGAATLAPRITVEVGFPEPQVGRVEEGQAVVARADDGALWLLEGGRRYRLVDNAPVLLGLQGVVTVALPGPVLDVLPEGLPIAAPAIPDRGAPAAGVPASWVMGDVVRVQAGGVTRLSYAVLADGLSPGLRLHGRVARRVRGQGGGREPGRGERGPSVHRARAGASRLAAGGAAGRRSAALPAAVPVHGAGRPARGRPVAGANEPSGCRHPAGARAGVRVGATGPASPTRWSCRVAPARS
jgi:type VII secretion protein EccB